MKTLSRLPLALCTLLAAAALTAGAQELVTTGTVEKFDEATGNLTVRSDQTQRPMLIQGANRAVLVQSQGQPPNLADLRQGVPVTIQYAERNRIWYASKITYSGDAPGQPLAAPIPTGQTVLNPNNTSVTINPNNTRITVNPNNTSVTANPNNTSVTTQPNNTKMSVNPNNTSVSTQPNNTKTSVNPNNTGVSPQPNNTKVNVNPNNTDAPGNAQPAQVAPLRRNGGGGNASSGK